MSSGHNTNRGRNGNGGNGNGGSNRRARRMLSHQRNPAAQSVLQHRADFASAPVRMSEVSASLEQEESSPTPADRTDPAARQAEGLGLPVESVPPAAGESGHGERGEEDSPPQAAGYPDRLDPSTGQPRPNRRSPQLMPSPPAASTEIQATRDSTSTLTNSIRAPFAPGHNHLPPANNLRSAFPPAVTDGTISSDRSGAAAIPLRGREEGAPQFSESVWESAPAKRMGDESGDDWPRIPSATGRMGNTYRDAGSHQERGSSVGPVFLESRDVRGDIGELIDSLHQAFELDRGIASQGDTARCGICYLHYFLGELQYREEEGYYVCPSCARTLSHTRIMMVRRQQRL